MNDTVLFERPRPHVALVTLNRPEARNAINIDMSLAFKRIYHDIESDPDIWISVLAGTPPAFCAGADLKQPRSGALMDAVEGGMALFMGQKHTKPWIAAVRGYALGGGTEMALACDMIVAGMSAVFGLPEVKRGLVAISGVTVLPRIIPRNLAMELIATGAHLPAARAHELGIVNRLVADDRVVEEALALADAVCENAPVAVRESVALARRVADLDRDALWTVGKALHARLQQTEDYTEGRRAFAEKRKPRWSGR
jgi:enoyl-CoA hydratase/carnithine racemase